MTDPKDSPFRPGDRPGAAATGGTAADAPMYADEASGASGAGPAPDPGSAPSSGANDASAQRIAALEQALAQAETKATEHYEQFLRASADMENVRRRAQEDVSKAHKFAIENFAESLLPVRDSLEMALKVEVPTTERLKEGVEATLRQLSQAFERNRLAEIDPLHQKFDPNQHQAISMVPAKDVAPNHVVAVLQKGYKINDRVLRPALVTVSQAK